MQYFSMQHFSIMCCRRHRATVGPGPEYRRASKRQIGVTSTCAKAYSLGNSSVYISPYNSLLQRDAVSLKYQYHIRASYTIARLKALHQLLEEGQHTQDADIVLSVQLVSVA